MFAAAMYKIVEAQFERILEVAAELVNTYSIGFS